MSRSRHAISASYALCRRTARRAGSNFYTSFLLLPRSKRRAMDALYAFTRYTDDLVDNSQPAAVRREALAQWRTSLEAVADDRPVGSVVAGLLTEPPLRRPKVSAESRICGRDSGGVERPAPSALRVEDEMPGEALLPALRHTVERFSIPPEHLLAVVDGVQMDLDRASYETFEDLLTYCRRVASAVGLACIHVWGFRGDVALEPARKCGIALQITNILRDLNEDAQGGRVYLPLEDLRHFGYSVDDLCAGVVDERFVRMMKFQIDRARRFYREGAELFDCLERDGRRVFGMIMSVYYRLLERIERCPSEVFRRRVRLSRREKLCIAARWALLPARRSALPMGGMSGEW